MQTNARVRKTESMHPTSVHAKFDDDIMYMYTVAVMHSGPSCGSDKRHMLRHSAGNS
jgi:hypothetical protein